MINKVQGSLWRHMLLLTGVGLQRFLGGLLLHQLKQRLPMSWCC